MKRSWYSASIAALMLPGSPSLEGGNNIEEHWCPTVKKKLKRSFGSACHWHPFRRTYMIASKIVLDVIGFLPSPVFRLYSLLGSLSCGGINGSTISRNASDTFHDFVYVVISTLYNELVWEKDDVLLHHNQFIYV